MTEATHPAVGEKRQVGRGALAWTAPAPAACEIISCWALVVAFGQQSKLFTAVYLLHPCWKPGMKSSSILGAKRLLAS